MCTRAIRKSSMAIFRCRNPRSTRGWQRAHAHEDAIMQELPPFHLAFPVRSLEEARAFYGDLLGCPEGRSSDAWVDFDFYGHQIVAHLAPEELRASATHDVDGDAVPVRHFGVILDM